jgi:hypothetical protein
MPSFICQRKRLEAAGEWKEAECPNKGNRSLSKKVGVGSNCTLPDFKKIPLRGWGGATWKTDRLDVSHYLLTHPLPKITNLKKSVPSMPSIQSREPDIDGE